MTRTVTVISAFLLSMLCGLIIWPSREAQALPPKNLKFYDKKITQTKLYREMKIIARQMGVKCAFCHVMMPRKLFHKDRKAQKAVALKMLRLTKKNNDDLLKIYPGEKEGLTKITCYTCHRGKKKPQNEPFIDEDDEEDPEAEFKKACEEHKDIDKAMDEYTKQINKDFKKYFPKKKKVKVTCYTCHRGKAKPLEEIPDDE